MFFRKDVRDREDRKRRDKAFKQKLDDIYEIQNDPNAPDKSDIFEYNMYVHEQDMKKRREGVFKSKEEALKRKALKEKIYNERINGNPEVFGGSIDHSNCSSKTRTVVFDNVKVFKYPAIVSYEFNEYNGYAFGYESCTGRGKTLQECLDEIGMDLRYPLQDYFNENYSIPSYTRDQILQDSRAFMDIKNGAKIKLVNVEIETR